MSQLIHMDTEIVTKLSASINQCANTIDERSRAIRTTLESASWEGDSRDDLVYRTANQLTNSFKPETSNLKDSVCNSNVKSINGFRLIAIQ